MGLVWFLVGFIMFVPIITIPWAKKCFMIGKFCLFPFGKQILDDSDEEGDAKRNSIKGKFANLIWVLTCGWWMAIGHIINGILICCTVIGIPFGRQHFKLAKLCILPVGKTITSV